MDEFLIFLQSDFFYSPSSTGCHDFFLSAEKQEANPGSHSGRAEVRRQQQQPDEAGGDGDPPQDAL